MTGPVNVKTISTQNVKSGRSGKCENNSTLNMKKVWSVAQFGRPGQFFSAFSGFGVSTFQRLNILGSVVTLRENEKL